ncbi:hypothetical protein KAU93_03275 [Candidatus Bathyarchaeota archaeon]|nr:hypothetical protein [Candidatus Bathyarchaeota archaeon]MCK4474322.1 hypothetical protein [Candidatus Bathyarchaeota archaeon]
MSQKRSEPPQIPLWLFQSFKSGEINLSTSGTESLQLKIEHKRFSINLLRKELLKDILSEVKPERTSILRMLAQLKNTAERLKKTGLTITISYKDEIILTLGAEANPTLSKLVTRTNAIQVNNLTKLTGLIKEFR